MDGPVEAQILMLPSDRPPCPHRCQTSLGPFQYASLNGYDPFQSLGARMKRPEFLGFFRWRSAVAVAWPSCATSMPLARDSQVIE
jgi:hypothetical protein